MFLSILLTGGAGVWAFVVLLQKLYYICQPSENQRFAGLADVIQLLKKHYKGPDACSTR